MRSKRSFPLAPDAAFGLALRRTALVQAFLPVQLRSSQVTALAREMVPRHYTDGQLVLARGAVARSAWLVATGCVGQGGVCSAQQWQPQRWALPGHWLDLHSAWIGMAHSQDAISKGESIVLELPRAALRRLPSRLALLEAVAAALACEVLRQREAMEGLMTRDVRSRLAMWLLEHAQAVGGMSFRLPLRKGDLAGHLGTTAASLSRAFTALATSGAVEVRGRTLVLLDLPCLSRIAYPEQER